MTSPDIGPVQPGVRVDRDSAIRVTPTPQVRPDGSKSYAVMLAAGVKDTDYQTTERVAQPPTPASSSRAQRRAELLRQILADRKPTAEDNAASDVAGVLDAYGSRSGIDQHMTYGYGNPMPEEGNFLDGLTASLKRQGKFEINLPEMTTRFFQPGVPVKPEEQPAEDLLTLGAHGETVPPVSDRNTWLTTQRREAMEERATHSFILPKVDRSEPIRLIKLFPEKPNRDITFKELPPKGEGISLGLDSGFFSLDREEVKRRREENERFLREILANQQVTRIDIRTPKDFKPKLEVNKGPLEALEAYLRTLREKKGTDETKPGKPATDGQ